MHAWDYWPYPPYAVGRPIGTLAESYVASHSRGTGCGVGCTRLDVVGTLGELCIGWIEAVGRGTGIEGALVS